MSRWRVGRFTMLGALLVACGDSGSEDPSGGTGGATSVASSSATTGAGGAEPGPCDAILSDPGTGTTTLVITNTTDAPVTILGADTCATVTAVDGKPILLAGQDATCDHLVEGTLEPCQPTSEELAPGATVERAWSQRVLETVPVPAGCDSAADDLDLLQCERGVVVEPGPHRLSVLFDAPGESTRVADVDFQHPVDTLVVDLE
jgi:hypothetical protein